MSGAVRVSGGRPPVRGWAWAGLLAQVVFVVAWLVAAATIGFAWLSLRPALRSAGRRATVGVLLLTLSIFGLGDLLSPLERLACQQADPACSPADQLSNLGGTLDGLLSTVGILFFAVAGFVLASAMSRLPGWARCARWTRVVTLVFVAAFLATGFLGDVLGLGGLFERLVALAGATGIGLVARRLLMGRPRSLGRRPTGTSRPPLIGFDGVVPGQVLGSVQPSSSTCRRYRPGADKKLR